MRRRVHTPPACSWVRRRNVDSIWGYEAQFFANMAWRSSNALSMPFTLPHSHDFYIAFTYIILFAVVSHL